MRTTTPSSTQGFALCMPDGSLLGHTYRPTHDATIAAIFDLTDPTVSALWAERVAAGWTVEPVYARVFTPVFYVSAERKEEAA